MPGTYLAAIILHSSTPSVSTSPWGLCPFTEDATLTEMSMQANSPSHRKMGPDSLGATSKAGHFFRSFSYLSFSSCIAFPSLPGCMAALVDGI